MGASGSIMLALLLAILVGLALWFGYYIWRGRRLLQEWAKDKGYEIVHAELRPIRRGLAWLSPKAYRVTVLDKQRHIRKGWVRIDPLASIFSDRVDARMDDGQSGPLGA